MKISTLRLFYFGNEQQKSDVYYYVVLPLLSKYLSPCSYYVKRDWNGGPNYKVIFREQPFNSQLFYNEFLSKVNSEYHVTANNLLANIASYEKLGSVIGSIERADTKTVDSQYHLKMTNEHFDFAQVKKLYNSRGHFELQLHSLMSLQAFVNQRGREIYAMPDTSKYVLFMQLMLHLLRYSHLEDKYSMMVYLSNSEGILAIAEQYGKRDSMLEKFKLIYNKLPLNVVRTPELSVSETISQWDQLFADINDKIKNFIQTNELYTEGYYSQGEQHEHLQKNVAEINSDFHNQVLMNNLTAITGHKLHQQFRFLVNIEYQVMHMLGITFKEKAFLCYGISRFIMDETGSDWREILSERRIVNEIKDKK